MPDLAALARSLLPGGVATAGGPVAAWQGPLLGDEGAALTRARPARRAEFTAGRCAARAALARLGLPPVPLPRDRRGPALWPPGVTGSISHGAGQVLAAVAHGSALAGLGIDVEAAGAFVPLDEIATSDEIAALGSRDPVLLFSAREAAFKAQFTLTGRMLEFRDLALELGDGHFHARLGTAAPPLPAGMRIAGRWAVREGIVVTAAAIAA